MADHLRAELPLAALACAVRASCCCGDWRPP